MGLTNYCISRY